MTLPQRRCGGFHSAMSCPACRAMDQELVFTDALARERERVRVLIKMLEESHCWANDEFGDVGCEFCDAQWHPDGHSRGPREEWHEDDCRYVLALREARDA